MREIIFIVGLLYVCLTGVLLALFAGVCLYRDAEWRVRQRKRAKSVFIREWRLP